MAEKVTSTITVTDATIIVFDIGTNELLSRSIRQYAEMGKEAIKRYAYKHFDGALSGVKANNLQFIKVDNISYSSTLREMDMDKFILLGKVITDDDSKLGKVTRTINKLYCSCKVVNDKEEFTEATYLIPNIVDETKRKKYCQKEAEKNGCIFISIKEATVKSCVVAVDKDVFVNNSEEVKK